jgi:hypothetical protein
MLLNTRDYHDEDYDGIVLKIPSWFIKMNNLEDAFKAFETALKSADRSMFYPDHVKNLYELNNIDTKKKEVADRNQAEREKLQIIKDRHDKIHSGEMHELEWVEKKSIFDGIINMPDGSTISWEDAFTKGGVKAAAQKEFSRQINSFDSLKKLSKLNPHNSILWNDLHGATEDFIQCDYQLFQSSKGWEVIGMSYKRLMVKTDWSLGRKRGWLYYTQPLIVCPDGCLAIHNGGNIEKAKIGRAHV